MNTELDLNVFLTDGTKFKVKGQVNLEPFYCIEEDVINPFDEFTETKSVFVRQIIHNCSITVLNKTRRLEQAKILSEEELFAIRRDYTICLATCDLTKKLRVDAPGMVSRSKALGDFSVSVNRTTSQTSLAKIYMDTQNCIKEAEQLIKDLESEKLVPALFVKGIKNPYNQQAIGRLWWLSEMHPKLVDGYASQRIRIGNFSYKAGNIIPYSRVSSNGDMYDQRRFTDRLGTDGFTFSR